MSGSLQSEREWGEKQSKKLSQVLEISPGMAGTQRGNGCVNFFPSCSHPQVGRVRCFPKQRYFGLISVTEGQGSLRQAIMYDTVSFY